jgi:hypothetical protein
MTIVTHRPGKFKFRVEINWNDYDPYICYKWCERHIDIRKNWFRKDIRHGDLDYTFYFYFKQATDATMFVLKWS